MKTILPSLARKAGLVMMATISILLAGVLLLVCVLLVWSYPGKPQPFLDANGKPLAGSVSEKIRVDINGLQQGMFIEGKNIDNPVLLFIHGGPGMPEYWLTQDHSTGLEDYFTVVWWDQRGAGLSYSPNIPSETMTAEQFVSDTIAVTNYLRQRFHKDKIYLLAHSWGSYIGIQAAAQHPELYYAYVGMGQVSHQIQSEQMAYAYALEYYKQIGNLGMLKKLEAAPPTQTVPLPKTYLSIRDEYMHSAGIGTTHAMTSVVTGIFLPSLQFREYTLVEKINLWRGKISSRSPKFSLWDQMQMTDMSQKVPELKIPVYFLEGRFDYTCAYPLARDYFDKLSAPIKGFYTFENSAHTPLFEEPDKVRQVLLEDVLTGQTNLADQQ
jgi:pimeloyl-ACP methyl ester carboxylesterase